MGANTQLRLEVDLLSVAGMCSLIPALLNHHLLSLEAFDLCCLYVHPETN